jgi:hypothetical protein
MVPRFLPAKAACKYIKNSGYGQKEISLTG